MTSALTQLYIYIYIDAEILNMKMKENGGKSITIMLCLKSKNFKVYYDGEHSRPSLH